MKKCPNCGKEYREGDKFCGQCGTKIFVITEKVENNVPRTCWACGIENASNSLYCKECGTKLATNKAAVRFVNEFEKKSNISFCPKCGSHNIKIYRRGYDYKVGFWGSIFKVRGSGYAGGFGANNACCRCIDCGKDWETDYDYRLL